MSKYIPDMRSGDDYSIRIVSTYTNGLPADITGFTFWLTLKSSFEDLDTAAALQHSVVAGSGINDDATQGVCFLLVPASKTKDVEWGSYYYDIQQKAGPTGGILTVLPPISDYKDKIKVVPGVTKAVS